MGRLYKDKIPHVKNYYRGGSYFYTTNFSNTEKELFKLEMKYLFHFIPEKKHFFSTEYINPSISPFIRHCISVRYAGETLKDITTQLKIHNFYSENFKVYYINIENDGIGYHERRKIEGIVGSYIKGSPALQNPGIIYGISQISGLWIFGECESSDFRWQQHKRKPISFSNALTVELSRAVSNISAAKTMVDPCCGVGTVVIESLDLGLNIKGYDQNPKICSGARKNLEYFGFEDVIYNKSINSIDSHFDASIIDLPYGLFTDTCLDKQLEIIKCARKISDSMCLITTENMESHLTDSGYKIEDQCSVSKGKFQRIISVCR